MHAGEWVVESRVRLQTCACFARSFCGNGAIHTRTWNRHSQRNDPVPRAVWNRVRIQPPGKGRAVYLRPVAEGRKRDLTQPCNMGDSVQPCGAEVIDVCREPIGEKSTCKRDGDRPPANRGLSKQLRKGAWIAWPQNQIACQRSAAASARWLEGQAGWTFGAEMNLHKLRRPSMKKSIAETLRM